MLTATEFAAWADRLGLGEAGRRRIQEIRGAQPSRGVDGRVGNVTVRYPSRKMGWTIQGESVRGEWAAILDLEYDPDVLEYYEQAGPIRLQYRTKNGRLGRPVLHTPDLFVLRRASVGYEECKPNQKLRDLATRSPHRYSQEADGTWRCPPAEDVAGRLGFSYRIRCADDINWVANRNLVFLEDYLRQEHLPVPEDAVTTIRAMVAAKPAIVLRDLLQRVREQGLPIDYIFILILRTMLYVDLRSVPLADADHTPVFLDETQAAARETRATTHATAGMLTRAPQDRGHGGRLGWVSVPHHQRGSDACHAHHARGSVGGAAARGIRRPGRARQHCRGLPGTRGNQGR